VRQPVLIPRPETEDWVSNLAIRLRDTPFRPLRLIDLGTGTGCIPLLLASLLPPGSIRAVGVDISPDAVKLATENRDKCGIPDHAFQPVLADYTAPEFTQFMTQPYHVVTSNPPYISREEYIRLPTCVKDFEDRSALLGGEDGLFFYRAIANLIGRPNSLMAPNGMLVMEIGPTQAESVIDIMHKVAGLSKTQVWNDAAGHPRTVIAYKE
jgi:HemK-like putative methylase